MSSSDQCPISKVPIGAEERVDDLQFRALSIIQKRDAFRFGTDAVLLSDFALVRKRDLVADLGTGTGVVALLMAAHHEGIQVDALELQPEMAEMAARSVTMNDMDKRVRVHCMNMLDAPRTLGYNRYDGVVCNPPYSKAGAALLPKNENQRISRMETQITIEEICQTAFALLKSGGRFSVVFPAQRMLEMMNAMQKARLAPKRVRCVQGTIHHAPRLVLIDAVKQGGEQLHWLSPLIMYETDGSPSAEWKRIYGAQAQ